MTAAVWDREFLRRRASGEQAPGPAQEPTPMQATAVPAAPQYATIAELLLARAADDNTGLLFEDKQ